MKEINAKILVAAMATFLLLVLVPELGCQYPIRVPKKKIMPPPNGPGNYGAIAFSTSTGAWGWSNDYSSVSEAQNAAMNSCGKPDCQAVVWFKNNCGALAVGKGNCWGTGWADSRAEAERLALNSCRNAGDNCKVACWSCNSR